MKRTTCWPAASTEAVHAPAGCRPVAERSVKYGDVGPPAGRTAARSRSENAISTGALREIATLPGGGTIETITGREASRTSGGQRVVVAVRSGERPAARRERDSRRVRRADRVRAGAQDREAVAAVGARRDDLELTARVADLDDRPALGRQRRDVAVPDVPGRRVIDDAVSGHGRRERDRERERLVVEARGRPSRCRRSPSTPRAPRRRRCRRGRRRTWRRPRRPSPPRSGRRRSRASRSPGRAGRARRAP